jgi:LysR family hydrogen peroxide-inducible transcriptional activator
MRLPTLRQLQYFLALTETGHFGRAADLCFVSQSAFSNAIQELESSLGAELVDRTNRNVTITATGQEVAVQARLVMDDVESLVDIARGRDDPLTGELRLGVIPTIAPFVLPGVLPKLRKQYPELELLLTEDQTERIYRRLMDGELDVLLLALPWSMKGVEELPLFRDLFCLACREGTDRVDPEHYRPHIGCVQNPQHPEDQALRCEQPAHADRDDRCRPRYHVFARNGPRIRVAPQYTRQAIPHG